MNLKGETRFGPNIEWLDVPQEESDVDFWSDKLSVDEGQLDSVYEAVRTFLPGVNREGFAVDCESLTGVNLVDLMLICC